MSVIGRVLPNEGSPGLILSKYKTKRVNGNSPLVKGYHNFIKVFVIKVKYLNKMSTYSTRVENGNVYYNTTCINKSKKCT